MNPSEKMTFHIPPRVSVYNLVKHNFSIRSNDFSSNLTYFSAKFSYAYTNKAIAVNILVQLPEIKLLK